MKLFITVIIALFLLTMRNNSASAQGVLTNGWTYNGTIVAGQSNTWTFTANSGDNLVVEMGRATSSTLYPYLRLYGPGGSLLASTASAGTAAEVTSRATNSGTFTVIAANNDGYVNGGNGAYQLTLGKTGSPIVVAPGDQGGPLTNGFTFPGTLAVGQLNVWSITATSGDNLVVEMGRSVSSSTLYPYLRLYGPDGSLLASTPSDGTEAEVATHATNSGTFTVIADNNFGYVNGGNGAYQLTLGKTGSPIVVAPGDQGGPLTNGFTFPGTLAVGQLNVWSFTATSGDNLVVEMGRSVSSSTLYPYLRLYGPDGSLLASTPSDGTEAEVATHATNSGTFTVIADNDFGYVNGGNGTYQLTLGKTGSPIVVAPGDQGGPLTNGFTFAGNLAVGQLNVWSFTANSGDNLVVEMGRSVSSSTLYPYLRLYGPNGSLLTSAPSDGTQAEVATRATNSGTFTVIADNNFGYVNGGSGTYQLTLGKTGSPIVVAPGDQGGPLTNGFTYAGSLAAGQLNVWSFTATSGDSLVLGMGRSVSSSTLYPYLRLYGPDGSLLTSMASAGTAAEVTTRATNSGSFTVIADNNSGYFNGGNGAYQLTLGKTGSPIVVAPGDEGGSLNGSEIYAGALAVGELDVWQFTQCAGDEIALALTNAAPAGTLHPYLRVYNPDGTLLASAASVGTVAQIAVGAVNTGTYVLIAANNDAYFNGGNGTFQLTVNDLSDGLKTCSPVISGTNLDISGVGGVPGTNAVLLTATNITTPAALWIPIRTNAFDQFGVFASTNGFNSSEAQRYFRLYYP